MKLFTILLVGAALAACAGCGDRPLVLQGVVVSYDQAAATVVVKDEIPPSEEVAFSLAGADIGVLPAPGDLVRLAYRVAGGEKRAIRMMNLTRQAELAKKGGAH
ncbi:MAG: hypothetical protein AB1806_20440 [Acidobacteriota bacterium]